MEKIYLLLRNNKQSGPYTLSELIALQLKPLDLIWVEGRSRSWAYPTEMNELKSHVKEDKKKKESVTVYPEADSKLVLPRTNNKTRKGTKEEKVNVQVYVKLPNESQGDRFLTDSDELAHIRSQESSDQKTGPVVQNADGLLNTKYTRDLQDIKAEYTAWIGQRKKEAANSTPNNPWLIWSIIAFLGVAGFLTERWASPGNAANQGLKTDSLHNKKAEGPLKTQKNKKKKAGADKNNKNKKTAAAKKEEKKKSADTTLKTKEETVRKKNADAQSIFKQMDISSVYDTAVNGGITALRFTLHNGSQHKLHTVAVNVYYNGADGRQLAKETIYFTNVPAGNTSTTPAPSMDKATSVHYKIALINTEESIFYGKE
jgi:hypothetical protein